MTKEKASRPKNFKEWLENFWYHYKYHTIVVAVAFVAISVSLVQCAMRTPYDYQVVLGVCSAEMAPEQIEGIEKEIAKYCKDQNGDGEVLVNLIDCTFNEQKSSYQTITAKRQKIQSILMNEQDILVYIMDKKCFSWLDSAREEGFMEPLGLSEENSKYFNLTDTNFYKNAKTGIVDGLIWPEEIVVSRRIVKGTFIEKNKGIEKSLEKADELVKKIIEANKK